MCTEELASNSSRESVWPVFRVDGDRMSLVSVVKLDLSQKIGLRSGRYLQMMSPIDGYVSQTALLKMFPMHHNGVPYEAARLVNGALGTEGCVTLLDSQRTALVEAAKDLGLDDLMSLILEKI